MKHMAGILLKEKDIKKLLKHSGRTVYKSLYKMLRIPALGAFGYLVAFCIVMYVFIKHIFSKK